MFSRSVPLNELVEVCRQLRHNLSAGVGVVRVLQQMRQRGPASFRPVAQRLDDAVQRGEMLSDALQHEKESFPPLFLALVKLGEETGNLPEILRELEQYFQLELKLRRQFKSQLFPTAVQFVLATLIVAGLLFILGQLATSDNKPRLTFLGLSGAPASLAFLGVIYGSIFGALLLYKMTAQLTRQRAAADRFLLNVPVLGPCLETIALSRFTLALQLTLDSGLGIAKALRLSLQATANAAFIARTDVVVQAVKGGQTLFEALQSSGLFSIEFLNIVASAEEGGRVPEMMRHQAEYYQEETARRLTALTRAANGIAWLAYAGFMVWMISRIAGVYLGALDGK
jgi:type IV pilus assembly protein PilC